MAGEPYAVPGRAVQITDRATCVLAPNPSAMTLDGTNTWILAEPGSTEGIVVDPGPLDETHLVAVADACAERRLRIRGVFLTHHHADHAAGAADLARRVGAEVHSPGRDGSAAGSGSQIEVAGLRVQVLAAPGHTADSVCFLLPDDASLLTGDTVLGRGTTVVAWPDGRLGEYLDTLTRLRRLVDVAGVRVLLPGHGAPRRDPAATLVAYLEHRHARLEAVRAALAELVASGSAGAHPDQDALATAIVERVYADVPRDVWPAARSSVRAQLDHLAETDRA